VNDEFDETFDEKTFVLQLRATDNELRHAALATKAQLERLARMRALDEGISFVEAWRDIFEVGRMRHDLLCSNDLRARLACVIWDELAMLRDRGEALRSGASTS
jgi:hypothetical protein